MKNGIKQTKDHMFTKGLNLLKRSKIPFLLGGALALHEYVGISRNTEDLDIFCKPEDYLHILDTFKKAGFKTEETYPWWLAKVFSENSNYIDIIYSSANNLCRVDDLWFKRAKKKNVFGIDVLLIPPEEMFWSKSFVQTRERYDGIDIHHLILKQGKNMNWKYLLMRMENNWQILLSHIITFYYVYPSKRDHVPNWLIVDLLNRQIKELESAPIKDDICRGPLLSPGTNTYPTEYLMDITNGNFRDARDFIPMNYGSKHS